MIPAQNMALGAPAIGLNGSAPRCEHLDGLQPVTPRSVDCLDCNDRKDRRVPRDLPDLRLGGLLRRLTGPARQGALRGNRPSAGGRPGAGTTMEMVLRPPASRLTPGGSHSQHPGAAPIPG